jgi:hypothetical protein
MDFNIICTPTDILNSSNLDPNRTVIPIKYFEFESQSDIIFTITTFYHIGNNDPIEKLLNSFFFADKDAFSVMETNIEYYKNGIDFISCFKQIYTFNDFDSLQNLIHIVSQFTTEGVFEFKVKCFVIVLSFYLYSKNLNENQFTTCFLNDNGYSIYWRFILACPCSKGIIQGVKRKLNNEYKNKLQEKFKLIKYKYNWKIHLKSSDLQ